MAIVVSVNFAPTCVCVVSPGPREEMIDRLKGYMLQVGGNYVTLVTFAVTVCNQGFHSVLHII